MPVGDSSPLPVEISCVYVTDALSYNLKLMIQTSDSQTF